MKKFIKGVFIKVNVYSVMNAIALILAFDTVNSACSWVMYQPDVPEELKKYKK